jgi:hypothetical protein
MYEIPYWISGMTVPEIISHLADHNLDCEGPYPRGETMSQWECRPPSNADGVEREVTIVGQNPEQIRLVVATISGDGEMPPEEEAADFLGSVAALPYEEADPGQARQWTRENMASGGKLTIGSAKFELYGEEVMRVLRIVAVGE